MSDPAVLLVVTWVPAMSQGGSDILSHRRQPLHVHVMDQR